MWPWIGIQPYGIARPSVQWVHRPSLHDFRREAITMAKTISSSMTYAPLVGYRESAYGIETTVFSSHAGLQRWANEQAQDTDVWYAATFDLSVSSSPISEVAR